MKLDCTRHNAESPPLNHHWHIPGQDDNRRALKMTEGARSDNMLIRIMSMVV